MRLPRRERLPFGEQLRLESALDEAFVPLREARTTLSPARVRAAVRWQRERDAAPPVWRGVALAGRLAESSLALGLTGLLFVATLGPLGEEPRSRQAPFNPSFVQILDQAVDEQRMQVRSALPYRPPPRVDLLDPSRLPVTPDGPPAASRPTLAQLMR